MPGPQGSSQTASQPTGSYELLFENKAVGRLMRTNPFLLEPQGRNHNHWQFGIIRAKSTEFPQKEIWLKARNLKSQIANDFASHPEIVTWYVCIYIYICVYVYMYINA